MGKDLEDKIKQETEDLLTQRGFDLVEFKLFPQGGSYTVRVMADLPKGGINLDDCSGLNKALFDYLDKTAILGEDFVVEINSPGLDRKLTRVSDLKRVIGKVLCVWLKEPWKEKTYLEGRLIDVNEENLVLEGEVSEAIDFSLMKCAKQRLDYE
jgi:ribosome maturation factor RimP